VCHLCEVATGAMRGAMRKAVTIIPAHQWVCDDCLVAYFTIIATHCRIGECRHQGDRS